MALQDITSAPHVMSILEHLTGDVRQTAFRTGNPHLATEVTALASNPRRIRKLSAEAAQEAVRWLDSAAAIEAVIAVETRQSVTDAAREQLRNMNVETNTSSNQRNVIDRTQRAVAKTTTAAVVETLSGMSALDPETTIEWLSGLSFDDMTTAIAALHSHVSIVTHEPFTVLVIEALRKLTASNHAVLVASIIENTSLCYSIVRAWDSVITDAVAEVFASVNRAPYDMVPLKASSSAHIVWEKLSRTDLLLWSNAYTSCPQAASLVFKILSKLPDEERYAYLSSTRNPVLADLLVEKAAANNWFNEVSYQGTQSLVTRLLDLDGIAVSTQRTLCTIDLDETTIRFLLSDKSSSEVIKAAVERFPAEDFGYALRQFNSFSGGYSRRMRYNHGDTDADEQAPKNTNMEPLVGALYKYSTSLPAFLRRSSRYSYSHQADITKGVASRLAAAIDDNDETWQLFWTLLQSSDAATVEQIVDAAKALNA